MRSRMRSGPQTRRSAGATEASARRDGASRGRQPGVRDGKTPDSRTRVKCLFSYVTKNPREQARLVKPIVSNSTFDRGSLSPTYIKPFGVLANGCKTGDWLL